MLTGFGLGSLLLRGWFVISVMLDDVLTVASRND